MTDDDFTRLSEAWTAAGLEPADLVPVLEAISPGQRRVEGERAFAAVIAPALSAVYVGTPDTVADREAQRLRLNQCVAYLLHIGALVDRVPGREAEQIVRR